jgi:DNA-binding response OmpR family regulator
MVDVSILKNHLMDSGRMSEEQLLRAEDYALSTNMPLEDTLIFLNMLDYESLGQCLAEVYQKPYSPLLGGPPSETAKEKVPLKTAERLTVFPVDFNPQTNSITLCVEDPEAPGLIDKIKKTFSSTLYINFSVASKAEITMAIDVHYKGRVYSPGLNLELPEDFTIVALDTRNRRELNLADEFQSEKRILLLEPDLDRYRALSGLLRREGFPKVTWVASLQELMASLKKRPADLLLANGRVFHAQGSWLKEIPSEMKLPPVSYYNLRSMLLGQEYPYDKMSEALISLISLIVKRGLKDNDDQSQEIMDRVRYCKLLAMKLNLTAAQVDSTVIAAWLSMPGVEEALLDKLVTPYGLEAIFRPDEGSAHKKRIESSILEVVTKYQILKSKDPEITHDIEALRKSLDSQMPSADEKALLETFLQVIRDQEFLKDAGKSAGRILIVDPNCVRDSSLTLRLENDGYLVTTVSDAEKAANVITHAGTDLVISEVNLGGAGGIRLCRALRSNSGTSHIPFFFLTAEEGAGLATECLEAGADDFLRKPADPEILTLKIRRILALSAPKGSKKGITGTLHDMSVTDIIQSLTIGDKAVEVHISSMEKKGTIFIQDGEIVHSRTGALEGEEAFYHLVSWQEGEFEILPCATFPSRTIYGSTMSLLMEGARMTDEGDPED